VSGVAVFGGQFDPPHLGHLAVARAARDQLDLDVLVMPDGVPPHRPACGSALADRLALAELAFAGEPRIQVVPPLHPDRPVRTVEILERMALEHPPRALHLLLGADQWAALAGWSRPERIRELATLVVAPRSGVTVSDPDVIVLDMEPVDLSSTEVRDAIASGGDPSRWVPAAVAAEIGRRRLYG
jgi:nicotinate-nucleotide adenylyltransferase